MLKRVIKVLTNNPTDIKGPVFVKKFEKENKHIKELESLLNTCDSKSKSFIENDIKKLKYGNLGESNIYYELKNSFIPMMCLHDIRIEYNGMIAQIDFLVVTPKYIYVMECKNLIGDITVTKDGEFIRVKKNSYGKFISKEGMYSPIVQNERHINIIKEILSEQLGYKNKLKRIESLIVTANPKTIINKKDAPKLISDKIIRHDQIIDTIKSNNDNKKIEWVFTEEDMIDVCKCLKKHHKEIDINYYKKYSLSAHDEIIEQEKNDEDLRESLKSYRLFTSKEEDIKPYMVFSNDTMEELILKKPKSIEELKKVKGFGDIKCKKYGEKIIGIFTKKEYI